MPLIPEDAAQEGFASRFGWGAEGLEALAEACDVVVIVDVLRFTSAVSVAVAGGSIVSPTGRETWMPALSPPSRSTAPSSPCESGRCRFVER